MKNQNTNEPDTNQLDWRHHRRRGDELMQEELRWQAYEEYAQVLRLNPNDAYELYEIAESIFASGNTQVALEFCEASLKVERHFHTLYLMSEILAVLGLPQEAAAYREESLRLEDAYTENKRNHR